MLDVVSVAPCTILSYETDSSFSSPSALEVPVDSNIAASFSRDDVPGNLRGGNGGGLRCMSLCVCEGEGDVEMSVSDPVAFPDA